MKSTELVEHIRAHLGAPQEAALTEILPAGPFPLKIHLVPPAPGRPCIVLVTEGMSQMPMRVPNGTRESAYAELLVSLPTDWPLTVEAFTDPDNYWPIEWLRILARYPNDRNTWIGNTHVISNGDPPAPFAPGTKQCCFLILQEPTEFGSLRTKDGKTVNFYELIPIYKEERDLKLAKSAAALLELFQKHQIENIVNPTRVNVANQRS